MIPVSLNHERLTWHPSLPAPFESAQSIFRKILALNHMEMDELCQLIQKQDQPAVRTKNIATTNSEWIDFERFGRLLDVEPVRLKNGFLDQLGFSRDHRFPTSREVARLTRLCPDCVAYGYQCVFFDLAIIAECPWHRRSLFSSLTRCLVCSPFFTNLEDMSEGGTCPACGTSPEKGVVKLCFNRFDEAKLATILGYCLELVEWRRSVRQATFDHANLLGDIDQVGEASSSLLDFTSWQLGHALASGKMKIYWKFRDIPMKVQRTVCHDTSVVNSYDQTVRIYDDEGKHYRSVRHNIHKRFVKSHRRCIAKLRALSREESLYLDGTTVCPVALAYLVWRMSIEGIGNVEGLHLHRKTNYVLRLMSPDNYRSHAFRLGWSYLGFFGLWHQLNQRCGKQKISVNFVKDGECHGYLWSSTTGGITRNFSPVSFNVLYPTMNCGSLATERCCSRKSYANDTVDELACSCDSTWAWSVGDQHRSTMFRIHNNALETRAGTFFHLNV